MFLHQGQFVIWAVFRENALFWHFSIFKTSEFSNWCTMLFLHSLLRFQIFHARRTLYALFVIISLIDLLNNICTWLSSRHYFFWYYSKLCWFSFTALFWTSGMKSFKSSLRFFHLHCLRWYSFITIIFILLHLSYYYK